MPRQKIPWSLLLMGGLWLTMGVLGVAEAVQTYRNVGSRFSATGLIGLAIGPGILMLSRWARWTVLLSCFPMFLVGMLFVVMTVAAASTREVLVNSAVALALLVLSGWQYYVLTRPNVRSLFQGEGAASGVPHA
jgi:hypothetical protein